jgi:hypothetical protein
VGVVDSGVDYHHSALGECFGSGWRVAYGYDFVGDDFDTIGISLADNLHQALVVALLQDTLTIKHYLNISNTLSTVEDRLLTKYSIRYYKVDIINWYEYARYWCIGVRFLHRAWIAHADIKSDNKLWIMLDCYI